MNKLANKVAVVTGASKGIGASIAQHLAAEGASVVVNYSTSKEGAEKVVNAIVSAGGKAVAVGANLTHEAEVRALFDATKQQYGRVDILVNNAGHYTFARSEGITSEP
jgi:3-oxoacyl-[acyl-carrier protein] reductase